MEQAKHGADTEHIRQKYNIENITDFSSNVNIFVPSGIDELLHKISAKDLAKYPDINYGALCKKLSDKYNVNKDNIIVGNGSTEIIFLISRLEKIKRVGILNPTFSEYERGAILSGKKIIDFFYEKDFSIDVEKIDLKKIDILFVCNPNNPSGNTNDFLNLLKKAEENGVILFVDETFMDFTTSEKSLMKYIGEYKNLFVLKAVTKFYAMTGLRLGYGFGSKEIIQNLWNIKEPWTVNTFAEILVDAIFDEEFEQKSVEFYKREIKWLEEEFGKIKEISAYSTEANYFLIKLPSKIKSSEFKKNMILKHKILIRDCSDYKGLGENHIRVNIKDRENNIKLMAAIRREVQNA